MKETNPPLYASFAIALLGLWHIASTLTFGGESPPFFYTNLLSGFLLTVIALKSRKSQSHLPAWTLVLLGIWLQMAPLLFWAPHPGSYVNDTLVGSLVIALAVILNPMPGHRLSEAGTIPPGWSYNPSAWPQRMPVALLAFSCWMISRYLAAYQLGYIDTVWDPFFSPGTRAVLESDVSKAFPVSDAGLGALAYTIEFFSACQGGPTRWRTAPWLVLLFGILVIPVSIVSTVLIILQPLSVGAWCTLCLITAALMLIEIPFAIGEVGATLQFLRRSKEKPFLSLLFQGGSCPQERNDFRSPSMDQPLWTLFRSSLSGMTFPWNLILSAVLGISLMAIPTLFHLESILYGIDPILGALITIVSVTSFAEMTRKSRWLNALFSILLALSAWISSEEETMNIIFLHIGMAAIAALLSYRKGTIRERFSYPKEF